MKLHFESDLDYQQAAIEAVCDLFRGQEICRTEFTVTRSAPGNAYLPGLESALGIGNRLALLDDELLRNLNEIQIRNGLSPSRSLLSSDFTVEMETGTGKTYVYLRTIFELNKSYGFTKFVIVVPSIAIKEGVYKTLQITDDHFRSLYSGIPVEYFLYDSSKPGSVRNFATSSSIQIMIMTVGAINKKDVNNLYKVSEKTEGERPIDLIKATRPIVIVDEPQSVDGGLEGRGKEALGLMHPLCTLRYSATHVNKHHMVFRLDAVDAYEKNLVKQIEVASATIENAYNKPYVHLKSVSNVKGVIRAKVEVDVETGNGVRRREVTVQDGYDLEQATNRGVYANFRIGELYASKDKTFMELRYPGGEQYLKEDEAYGDVDGLAVQREMIRRTIREHLDKEKRLIPIGIKVLSLFFVDEVSRYRQYDAEGNVKKGDYARIFEEEYRRISMHPDYLSLFVGLDPARFFEEVHNGYFSIDKKGGWSDTAENNQSSRENAERAYNLIMKDKEKLLSTDVPLKFIFSHSALREGWDNPNVFQICSLRNIQTERERRQTIGRGLRLCVNQNGDRVRDPNINTLTVIANESYEQFAENLQKEIETDTGLRFGIVESHQFAGVSVAGDDGQAMPMGDERSRILWDHLKSSGYIDGKGKVQDALKRDLKSGTMNLPVGFEKQRAQIEEILRKLSGRLEIRNADERRQVRLHKEVYLSPEFSSMWERIKSKTTYRVEFDNEKLIDDCVQAIKDAPPVARTRLNWHKADLAIGKAGVEATEVEGASTVILQENDIELPDLLTVLQDRTQLTRRTLVDILFKSGRLNDFKSNPQQFIELVTHSIGHCKRLLLVNGIRYQRLGDESYYAQELFEQKELTGYLKNMINVKKSVYEQVVYDSEIEHEFAGELEKNSAVKVFAKLPGWFEVSTPLGRYNPDWAVMVEQDGIEKLYFVVETKSTLYANDLRSPESGKIACGKAHFEAIRASRSPAEFVVAKKFNDVISGIKCSQ
ncbi:MAG: DEAD/DEAH box helicase family protein [Thermoplasmata archaeon]|uniref:DEAD/DEAH box helicase family protein n=1 Tax=Candidatus Sysuiplasma superficiale TaxID=2823368 RepID=A0A8J7YV58_9ARCH|nr:DEAD/DEAH box helicase family protein [Candidatus Sysuiplasma superficiale]